MKLFLVDGHALIFRMYYAFLGRPMVNTKGQDTSILFGFTKYILEIINREKPTHFAVAFDPPGGTFRNKLYPEYKANRSETPQLVIDALEPLTEIVKAMGIPVLMVKGFEADDVICSMAKRGAEEGMDVYMVTPDKDYGQAIDKHIIQYKPGKGGAESEIVGVQELCEKYKISTPSQIIDLLTICGDTSDNVPGVPGVGPVGAAKLLSKYGTVEGILAHTSELTPKQQESFRQASSYIDLSKKLVTILTDVPLSVSSAQMELKRGIGPELYKLFDLYEMRSLKRTADEIWSVGETETPVVSEDLKFDTVSPDYFQRLAEDEGCFAISMENGKVSVATSKAASSGTPAEFRSIITNPAIAKAGYDLKQQIHALKREGMSLVGYLRDVELMHYILNPERSHRFEALAQQYLGVDLERNESEAVTLSLFDEVDETPAEDCSQKRVVAMFRLSEKLREELGKGSESELYDRIEEPLAHVLADMEHTGVRIDPSVLKEFADSLRLRVSEREAEVRDIAGRPDLNVASPKQIGEVIFEQMKLDPKAKKPSKGSWPTDEETLLELAGKSPIIDAILDYRGTRKLLSTYIEPIPGYISPSDGRVHTTFNQALTSTGRLSSSNPNLQNIPIRTEQGREIRKAFTAGPGNVIMSADYSQIELRIMAHLCGDEHMTQAFRDGVDVHASMAAKIFGKSIEDVTPDDRRVAKTANFGIMYGISSFGLSQRLRCSRREAAQIIDDYFNSFPSIRGFIDKTLADARDNGYVQTLFGRKRYVPDVNSHNANVRAVAERNAVNAPIQGTAADIMKLAMVGVWEKLRERRLKSRMVLQIHDEIVLEVPENEIEIVKDILVSEMEGVVSLNVPLTVECNYGKNWLEAH